MDVGYIRTTNGKQFEIELEATDLQDKLITELISQWLPYTFISDPAEVHHGRRGRKLLTAEHINPTLNHIVHISAVASGSVYITRPDKGILWGAWPVISR